MREWCSRQCVGSGPIKVIGVQEVVAQVSGVAATTEYRDNPALVAMKVLDAAGALNLTLPDTATDVESDGDAPA